MLMTHLICYRSTSERVNDAFGGRTFSGGSTFIEDFLLTYRTFLCSPMEVGKKLLEWFNDPSLRDKVGRYVLVSFQM